MKANDIIGLVPSYILEDITSYKSPTDYKTHIVYWDNEVIESMPDITCKDLNRLIQDDMSQASKCPKGWHNKLNAPRNTYEPSYKWSGATNKPVDKDCTVGGNGDLISPNGEVIPDKDLYV